MKLGACRRKTTVFTMAVGRLRVFLPFFASKKTSTIGIVQGNIPAQRYPEKIITVTEKVVNVKWGGI
jgi:hypothetical protein